MSQSISVSSVTYWNCTKTCLNRFSWVLYLSIIWYASMPWNTLQHYTIRYQYHTNQQPHNNNWVTRHNSNHMRMHSFIQLQIHSWYNRRYTIVWPACDIRSDCLRVICLIFNWIAFFVCLFVLFFSWIFRTSLTSIIALYNTVACDQWRCVMATRVSSKAHSAI